MKIKALVLSLAVVAAVFTGCGKKAEPTPAPAPAPTANKSTDTVASASVVDNMDGFQKAISKDGTWIIAITKDLTTDKPLVVDGDFKNKKKDPKTNEDLYQRKIALYTQDANHKVTARFTLTAPSITFNSIFGSLEHGTFKGDVYVSGKNFKLVDQTIDGNLYFMNEDAQKTFQKMDATSKVTGKIELKK